jgi:GGDEF domain-containing protein
MAMRPATSRCVQRQYGLALIPEHGGDAAALLTAADTGMYVSKRAVRGRTSFPLGSRRAA